MQQLREKSIQMTTIQKAMIDLQDKIKRDRESWQMERTELRRRLDDYKRSHANDKERMEELLIEVGIYLFCHRVDGNVIILLIYFCSNE